MEKKTTSENNETKKVLCLKTKKMLINKNRLDMFVKGLGKRVN